MQDQNDICKICGYDKTNLELHIRKHNLSKKDYFDKFLKTNNSDICEFCKINTTKFISLKGGYNKYCSVKCAKKSQSVDKTKMDNMLYKMRNTSIEKYGKTHHMKTDGGKFKHKESIEKKYGVNHYSKTTEYKEKCKSTWLKNYGVDHPLKSPIILEKIKNTNINKYGVINIGKLPEIIEKIKNTKSEKYGNRNYNNRDKYKKTCIHKYGIDHYSKTENYIVNFKKQRLNRFLDYLFLGNRLQNKLTPLFKREEFKTVNNKYQFQCGVCNNVFCDKIDDGRIPRCNICYPYSGNISFMEIEFLDILNIKDRQFIVESYKVDGIDKNSNTIYEFLGDYWHGNPNIFNLNDINQSNHKTFSELYENTIIKFIELTKLGYNIKYIWENDWEIWLKNNDDIYYLPLKTYSIEEILI